ncbi:hypothetical protein N665_0029s0094 [Sinapis alba]|nr:hypothetical protein N665_0029s0094 [Sinapis alba]
MGGLKRKISTDQKIVKEEAKSVAFSKRRKGLYSKTSQLCVLSGAQVAILATSPCSKSHVSFYSFGHSSVDNVVSAFLKNQCPPREDHLGRSEFWWEDEGLAQSEDPKELSEAVDSVSRMLQNLKGLRSKALANREDAKKKEVVQTLNLQSTCARTSSCIHEDHLPENFHGLVKNIKEEDQKVEVSDNNNTVSTNQYSCSGSKGAEDEAMVVVHSGSNKDHQTDNNNVLPGELYGCNQEFDTDQIFDLVTSDKDLSMNSEMMDDVSIMMNQNLCSNSEAVGNGAVAFLKDLEQDNLQFSDFFSDLFSNGEL